MALGVRGDRGRRFAAGRVAQIRGSLTPQEWARVGGMVGFVVLLHVVGWVTLVALLAPRHYDVGGTAGAFGVGLGVTAYTLGLRHAFDADHIAAIDNTTRKLMTDEQRPLSVGFWFSLGHSTIVFGLCFLLATGIRTLAGQVQDENSGLQRTTGLIGTLVSGIFLTLIAVINLVVLVGIVRVFRQMRGGTYDEADLERRLDERGLLNRVLGRVTRAVTTPWQMYPVGVLFGLGFDTATEVSLLVLAGGAAASALPWYGILVLPVLFAAGMSLLDMIDGCFMNFAYDWAFSKPVRKVYYNIAVTGLSVAVALLVGGIELLRLLADRAGLTGGFWDWVTGVDLDYVGYGVLALFVLTWAVALAVWRFGRIEERWSAPE